MSDVPPPSRPASPPEDTDPGRPGRRRRQILKLPMGPVLIFFALGFAAIAAFVIIRYVLPGHTNY